MKKEETYFRERRNVDMDEKIFKELQARGHKLTKQRMAILKVLKSAEVPLTAEEIFLRIRAGKDSTSLATIYRNLKTLAEEDLVIKFGLLEDKVQYGLQSSDHNHSHNLVCLDCHKIVPLASCPLDYLREPIGKREGFIITEHRMELYGYCMDCERRKNGKKEEINRKEK